MSKLTQTKEYQDAYYLAHKEDKAKKNKARYDADPEKHRARRRITRPAKEKTNGSAQFDIGAKFGMLTIKSLSHKDKGARRYYVCTCDCGEEKIIHGAALTSGNTRSCGCLGAISAKKRALPGCGAAINQLVLGYKRHAKDRGFDWHLTMDDVVEISSKPCIYCGMPPTNVKKGHDRSADFIYSGIDRVDSKAGYIKNNCVPACKICNFAKSNMTLDEFASWAKRIGEKVKSREALAYSMGMKAGKKRDLTSNPQFSSYSERIAYRAGWMDAMKLKAAN